MSAFNWVDYVFLAIFIISMLSGLGRGFIGEVLSLLTWVISAVVASMFTKSLAAWFTGIPMVQSAISSVSTTLGVNSGEPVSMLAIGGSFIVLFIGSMIICSILAGLISQVGNLPGISIVNRLAGGVFGVVRGYIINVLIVFLVQISPLAQQAQWQQSQLVPMFASGANFVSNLVQPGLQQLKATVSQTLQNK